MRLQTKRSFNMSQTSSSLRHAASLSQLRAAHLFWKHLPLLRHNVKHQNQSEPSTDPATPVWEIVSGLLKWYQCSGDGWKLQEESVKLNCWQPESQYISRSSKWLLFLLDIPGVGSWIVNTHCMTLSQLQFLPLCRQQSRAPPSHHPPTRLGDRWTAAFVLQVAVGELAAFACL